jgi:hypothetical protein
VRCMGVISRKVFSQKSSYTVVAVRDLYVSDFKKEQLQRAAVHQHGTRR